MARLIVGVVLLIAAWGTAARAQCCGDCGGDGQVTINDLIVAVNNALNDCSGVPTPTVPPGGCPIDFEDDNTMPGTPDCYYVGRWNQSCGDADLEALWRSDGELIIVDLLGFDPGLFLGATVTGPGTAELICWFTQPDASDCESQELTGTVTLAANGAMLGVAPDSEPFTIEECAFAQYDGTLTDVITPPASQRPALRRAPVDPAALTHLRAAQAARAPQANFRRR